ncbi:MAG: TldD/PmbA family protein [archaeon]|nr:TldD/PmbA family protein [archaeon]
MINEISDQIEQTVYAKCDEYEIYLSQSKTIELECEKTDLNFAKEEINSGLGLRVIKDNKIGFAFTSDLNKIAEVTEQAISNTKLNKADENFTFSQVAKVNKIDDLYYKKCDEITLEESIEFLKDIVNKASDKCEVTSAGYSSRKVEYSILNSNGVSINDKETGYSVGLAVNAYKNDEISTAYDSQTSRFFDLDGDKLTEEVCNLALSSLDGKPIDTGDRDVVLGYYALAGLLSTFVSAFSAENVQRERSILKDKMKQQIVNENLTIIDDSTLAKGLGSGKCDGEGTVSQKTTLVNKGELNSFIYDIYTANKGNCESTGNGFRGSYSGTPSVGTSNLIFDFSDEVFIEDIKNGVEVTSVLGAHTANPISGDFSVEASNTFKIENGEIIEPVKKAMISGNIFELLKTAEKIKSETKQKGSFIIPKMLMHNLRVIGQD